MEIVLQGLLSKTCDKVICKPGYSKKPKASDITCDGDCTSGDCCKQNKTCDEVTCTGKFKKPKASGTICDGDCTSKDLLYTKDQTLVRRLHVPLDSLQKRVRRIRNAIIKIVLPNVVERRTCDDYTCPVNFTKKSDVNNKQCGKNHYETTCCKGLAVSINNIRLLWGAHTTT